MAVDISTMDMNPTRVQLKELLAKIDRIDLSIFIDTAITMSGEPTIADSSLSEITTLFKALDRADLFLVPRNLLANLVPLAQQTFDLLDRGLSKNISIDEIKGIIDLSEKLYSDAYQLITPIIVYSAVHTFDPEKNRKVVDTLISTLHAKKAEAEKQFSEYKVALKRDTDQLISDYRESLQKTTVAQEALHFKSEAEAHKKNAYGWLAAVIVIMVGTLCLAWKNYVLYQSLVINPAVNKSIDVSSAAFIQFGISKFFVFSLLVGALIWCGKMYRAHRHNYVVNRHRHNALNTFNTFVTSAHDQQTKDAVLLQATQCIYTPQASGYIVQENEANGFPQILEIIRGSGENKGKG